MDEAVGLATLLVQLEICMAPL